MYVKIEDLSFKYDNSSSWVLNGVNFTVQRDNITAILGESGSGKSTLLRLIAGFEIPHSGSISVNSTLFAKSGHFVTAEKRGVGMVFQDYALFPHMTVEENICFGLKSSKQDQKKRVTEVLDLIDMQGYNGRFPHELSGGQQQRVALARSIAPKPSLLLMDEPFSNLDAHLRVKIRRELKDIVLSADITTIFVTHDEEDVLDIANSVVVLKGGSLVETREIERAK